MIKSGLAAIEVVKAEFPFGKSLIIFKSLFGSIFCACCKNWKVEDTRGTVNTILPILSVNLATMRKPNRRHCHLRNFNNMRINWKYLCSPVTSSKQEAINRYPV
jgi:hypothetical protein